MLGGYRSKVPAYASTATFASVPEYLDVADQCLEAGFGAIKLHAWGDWRRDVRLAQELRAHVGDGGGVDVRRLGRVPLPRGAGAGPGP